jgi:hypothetical protein
MTLHMPSSDIAEQLKELQQLHKRVREAELNFLREKRARTTSNRRRQRLAESARERPHPPNNPSMHRGSKFQVTGAVKPEHCLKANFDHARR